MATPRETLKYYFRKYALPTEQQFAELIDAFVHKDEDMLTQEKIDGLTAALQSKVSSETLDQYKAEVQAMIDNATTGSSNISDRLDTAEDNIAGHELRIKALEQAEGVTIDEYLSNTSENPVQNKTVFSALEEKANQTEFQSLKEKIDTFLEDTDATDETINKWKEIESFLQGITDTKTLAGLLSDLKAEIIALIPEPEPAQQGNFVKQVADLDGYSEAQDGEIVQYVGQTSGNYTRGFFYERKAGKKIDSNTVVIGVSGGMGIFEEFKGKINNNTNYWLFYLIGEADTWYAGNYHFTDNQGNYILVSKNKGSVINYIKVVSNETDMGENAKEWTNCYLNISTVSSYKTSGYINEDVETSASWQVIPVGPCVG